MKWFAAVLVAALACGLPGLGQIIPEYDVQGRGAWLDVNDVPSGYKHLGTAPIAGPYYILINQDLELYCPVTVEVWVMAKDGERWPCAWTPIRPGP